MYFYTNKHTMKYKILGLVEEYIAFYKENKLTVRGGSFRRLRVRTIEDNWAVRHTCIILLRVHHGVITSHLAKPY